MCVIIYKSKKVSFNPEQIAQCWQANPHGVGIAYLEKGLVYWTKGFMDLDAAQLALAKMQDKELVVHFRLATHGSVTPKNTHPFPIAHWSKNKLKGNGDSLLMHNGIISSLESIGDRTDSHRLASELLSFLPSNSQRALLRTIAGKFALITKHKVELFGGFQEHLGLQCSNLYWLPVRNYLEWSGFKNNGYHYSYNSEEAIYTTSNDTPVITADEVEKQIIALETKLMTHMSEEETKKIEKELSELYEISSRFN